MAASKTKSTPLSFSHTEKVYFPSGFTKGEMIRYYLAIAPAMVPHLTNRPVTLIRFPNGVKGESFYEKNAPSHTPDWVRTFPVKRGQDNGTIDYIIIDKAETLAWCANLGAIEFHGFLHRAPQIDRPSYVAFDLDPGEGADILTCAEVAFLLKEIFAGLGLQAFPKVSGSKGLQLYVPLNTPVTYGSTAPFAKAVAELMERRHPALVVSKMAKALRRKKVLIDWSQNNQSKTTVSAYSLRAKRDEPFVSMPVAWEELTKAMKNRDGQSLFFSPAAAIARVKKKGDLFAPVLKLKQKLPKDFLSLGEDKSKAGSAQKNRNPQKSIDAGTEKAVEKGAGANRIGRQKEDKSAEKAARASLKVYAKKRDFEKTREPGPSAAQKTKSRGAARFVIQKHEATRLHFDFRLEMDGTLKSWAVPKGLPYEVGVKRAAFQVEDHPISYMEFEGTIPKGQYGGGTVMVWDIGTYEVLGGSLDQGDLKLWLHGKKLEGEWHIFRIKSDDAKPVWLIAKAKPALKALSQKQESTSVLTKRSMEKIASDNEAEWSSAGRVSSKSATQAIAIKTTVSRV